MKINKKIFLSIVGISIAMLMLNPITSYGALQGNGKSVKADNLGNWMLNVRKMEETGGTLGLSDTINSKDLMSSTETSNNLDIHMEKNTEYGAMAILSASAYGNQNKIETGGTTTGNKSGVVININGEWVAGGIAAGCEQFQSASERYKDVYTTEKKGKRGDALVETSGWHKSSAGWFYISAHHHQYCIDRMAWVRATGGGIFSYDGSGGDDGNSGIASPVAAHYTRAVVVIGEGL